jgi:hypothetical protein
MAKDSALRAARYQSAMTVARVAWVCPPFARKYLTLGKRRGSRVAWQAVHLRVPRAAAIALTLCVALAGCGKSLPASVTVEHGSGPVAAVGPQGAGGLSTKNTTRLGGSGSAIDAAAVAIAAYPGLTAATRPRTVALVDDRDWPATLAASVLAGSPLHAPLLYSEGSTLPQSSIRALNTLRPTGIVSRAGTPGIASRADTQVIRIDTGATPAGYRTRSLAASDPAVLAVALERFVSALRGRAPRQLIVTAADAPPAMTMPAAGLSAGTGAPILFVERNSIPAATRNEFVRLGQTSIYIVGPDSVVSEAVASELDSYGTVTRIAGATAVSNAIAVARFTDGSFGWGVEEPGHGLVFANARRPLDGPAAAVLADVGDYAPLLLLESPYSVPRALARYLSDLQPGSPPSGPVHGVYNHGWLIGDEQAISPTTQARLDSMLEVSSRPAVEPATGAQSTPTQPAPPTSTSESTVSSAP